jgi:hypothetical protein
MNLAEFVHEMTKGLGHQEVIGDTHCATEHEDGKTTYHLFHNGGSLKYVSVSIADNGVGLASLVLRDGIQCNRLGKLIIDRFCKYVYSVGDDHDWDTSQLLDLLIDCE